MTLKQQAREEFYEQSRFTSATEMESFIDSLIDRTIAACIAKVPEERVNKIDAIAQYVRGFNDCHSLTLEGLKELQHD